MVVPALQWSPGGWQLADGSALTALSALTVINLAGAVLIRQPVVLNLLYALAGRGSRKWPLRLRWAISKVHHVGGLHVGFAVAGTAWLAALSGAIVATRLRYPDLVAPLTLVTAMCLLTLLATVSLCAMPVVRARAHLVFEYSHRWGGWSAIGLFWVLTGQLALQGRGETDVLPALASDWHVWVLVIVTTSIAAPWLRLRRVPITVTRPSAHAAIVHVDDGVPPAYSSGVGISRSPLGEWHAFATVSSPNRRGYRLLVSRAGDWTGRFIDDPPTHIWLRGRPVTAPMARVAGLYERVVYVVTGSGIGPCLGQILANRVPARLIWSTRSPRATYGDALVDEVEAAAPHAVIWDTTRSGKPDLVRLALDAYPRLRRGGGVRREQQGGDVPPGRPARTTRHTGVRSDLGFVTTGRRSRSGSGISPDVVVADPAPPDARFRCPRRQSEPTSHAGPGW